jgi:hypothetical protein
MRITKSQQVREHLNKKGVISSWDAIQNYNATRLSAIIFNLRKEGYDIASIPQAKKDVNGNMCHYVDYKLIAEPKKPLIN